MNLVFCNQSMGGLHWVLTDTHSQDYTGLVKLSCGKSDVLCFSYEVSALGADKSDRVDCETDPATQTGAATGQVWSGG